MAEVHIEYSNTVRFAPFNGGYPTSLSTWSAGKLPVDHNLWYDIFDHNDPGKTGANWSLCQKPSTRLDGSPWANASAQFPLTKQGSVMRVDGDTTGDNGKEGMQSFSLQTSAEQAQAAVDAAAESETFEEHVVTEEAAADMEAGMSVVDCITAFGNYIPGATNLMDVCTPECEIILDSGFPVNMGSSRKRLAPLCCKK